MRLLVSFVSSMGLIILASGESVAAKPKLVVMISIDQFPYEYLERMRSGFSPNGAFLRLCDDGANYINCHHGQAVTKTGPGHSVFMTGTFPSGTGIVDNDWFDPDSKGPKKDRMYCVDDADCQIVGGPHTELGKSPKNLLASTLGDVLKLADPKARVFAIALKDRAGILMAGHSADGVYWLENGLWVTSTYYRNDLPPYLRQLNESKAVDAYSEETWSLMYSPERYTMYYPDNAAFEGSLPGSGRAFPHTMPKANAKDKKTYKEYTTAMTTSPFGNDYTLNSARTLIDAEKLGQGDATDIIAINLSSNDYVGHMFGPQSLEVQDMTYRTDVMLGDFFAFVERHLDGKPWVLALSSDHGVAPVPEYAKTLKLPAGRDSINLKELEQKLESRLTARLGKPEGKHIRELDDNNVYLTSDREHSTGNNYEEAIQVIRDVLFEEETIAAVYSYDELVRQTATEGIAQQFDRAFHPDRSGDVMFAMTPYQILGKTTATHGSPWTYDSHVPLLLWGAGIQPGRYPELVHPPAIAPTLARLIGVDAPPCCAVEALEKAITVEVAKPAMAGQ